MNESILATIKKLLGIDVEYEHFDPDIIMCINSVFFTLKQLGVNDESFSITGYSESWSDYVENIEDLQPIKIYIYLKVRKVFDPPTTTSMMDALNEQIKETEWRINAEVDKGITS